MRGSRDSIRFWGQRSRASARTGVVSVADGVGDDVPRLVPAVPLHVQQDAHQLGDDQGGMGVVDLDHMLLVEVVQSAVMGQMLAENGLNGGGDEEVLLLQSQALASRWLSAG